MLLAPALSSLHAVRSFLARSRRAAAPLACLALLGLLVFPRIAAAQPGGDGPIVTISPRDSTFNGTGATYSVSVTITWCSDAELNNATRSITLDDVDVSGSFTTWGTGLTGCVYGAHSEGTVVLDKTNDGVHTLSAMIEDVNSWLGGDVVGYTFRWPGYTPPKHDVRVVPQSYAIDAPASTSRTVQFTITNTGSRPATYTLTRSCARAATCTGGSPASVVLDTTASGRSATATLTFTTGVAGDTGLVRLKATNSSYSAAKDSATTDVFIAASSTTPSPGVTIVGGGDVVERSLCLTIAAGAGGAYECGDLRLAHALPTVTTWGKARTPVLLYNSAQAGPYASLQADVAPGSSVPQTVEARIWEGSTLLGSASWPGSQWTSNSSRRITVPVTTARATGVYEVVLEVKYIWSVGPPTTIGINTRLPIVNRSASVLGAGWWLAGLEQLTNTSGDTLAWVGGDGSVRKYLRDSNHVSVWRAANVSRPDSIYLSGSTYIRRLPSGTRVEFNLAGRHVATRPLVGHATYFQYDGSGRPSRIVIPTALDDGNQSVRYDFTYFADSVVATLTTVGSATRRTRALLNAGRITAIRDPDGTSVQFGYGTGGNVRRVQSRTDRRNYTTSYSYDTISHLAGHSLTLTGGQVIAQSFQPAESRGAPGTPNGAAQPVDSAYTLVDGPRTDVADVTRFWLNRYGGPATIRNAHGYSTTILFDATWPALAKEVRTVGGAITKAWYNSRGLVDSSKTVNFRSAGDVSGTSKYQWHGSLALPTRLIGAGGDTTFYSYFANGNVEYVQVGPNVATRTYAYYHAAAPDSGTGLYMASTVPGFTARDSVVYDGTLANPIAFRDRKGVWSFSERDELGRVRLARTQIDSTGAWRRDSTAYDLADRIVRQVSFGGTTSYAPLYLTPARITAPAETLYVRTQYDAEGNVTEIARWVRPNPAQLDTIRDSYLYDGADRKTSASSSAGDDFQQFTYDPAGDLLQSSTTLGITSATYDALGRATRRIAAVEPYSRTSCSVLPPPAITTTCFYSFPLSVSGSLGLPADTALFTYDAAGNVLRADNAHARIRRQYAPSGLILTDTLKIRTLNYATQGSITPGQDFTSHQYGIRYHYDAAGRLDSLGHPASIDPCVGACSAQGFGYDAATGRLTRVVDVLGNSVSFSYTLAGTVGGIGYPGGIRDSTEYDAEGLSRVHTVGTSAGKFIRDTLTRDPTGRVVSVHGLVVRNGQNQQVYNSYTGLGALAAMEVQYDAEAPKLELFEHDALGNQLKSTRYNTRIGFADDNPAKRTGTFFNNGRLRRLDSNWRDTVPQPPVTEYTEYLYDAAGRTSFEILQSRATDTDQWYNVDHQRAYYYDGNGRLALFELHSGNSDSLSWPNDLRAVNEWYRYDALGRRVLKYTTRTNTCYIAGCETAVERFVWSGNQLLYEIRTRESDPENDAPSGNGQYQSPNAFGVMGYTHASGIDRPIGAFRMGISTSPIVFFPQVNWRGFYETATKPDGSILTNGVLWAGAEASAYIGATPRKLPYEWFGSLVTEQADASGLMYRRNRYYDPRTGRFTTPDPIGVAGGLNAYGFGGGDPVNYSDPFGLCPEGVTADSARATGNRETTLWCNDGSTEVRQGGSRAWRNNNPGNLRSSSLEAGTANGFAVFNTEAEGNEAMWRLLTSDRYSNLTLWELVNKYAPASDNNNTEAYMAAITRSSGMGRDVRISELTETSMAALIQAMRRHEGWNPGTVTILPHQ